MLTAIVTQVADYVETHRQKVAEDGRCLVVRNGYGRKRSFVTGVGTLLVQTPRVEDRRVDEQSRKFRFTSHILTPCLKRTKSVEELIPWLYPKGISTVDFSEELAALVGPDSSGLSATTVMRLASALSSAMPEKTWTSSVE